MQRIELLVINFPRFFHIWYIFSWVDPEGRGMGLDPLPQWKSQDAIGFLRNTCTDPLEKQLVKWLLDSREVRTALCEIRWWLLEKKILSKCMCSMCICFECCMWWALYLTQWRSQNAENVTHNKGRLLDQAVILFNCVTFHNGNFA